MKKWQYGLFLHKWKETNHKFYNKVNVKLFSVQLEAAIRTASIYFTSYLGIDDNEIQDEDQEVSVECNMIHKLDDFVSLLLTRVDQLMWLGINCALRDAIP